MSDYRNLIAVTDRGLCRGDFLTQIQKAVCLHPNSLILREKDLEDAEYLSLAQAVQSVCHAEQVPFYVHGRPGIARAIGCENLHLSLPALRELTSGMSSSTALRIPSGSGWKEGIRHLSVSCHSLEDVMEAVNAGADRVILGTIFATDCKPGLRGKGLGFVREVCEKNPVPVYAIGGIKPGNLQEVMKAGAAGGCMMSGFMQI